MQVAIEYSRMVEYRPISLVSLEDRSAKYIDSAYFCLYVQCKITQVDGTNLAVAGPGQPPDTAGIVAPVKNFLHSLFSQLNISLNGKLISSSSVSYSYRACLETLLNYSVDAASSHLTTVLWYLMLLVN